ncbi:MAG: zinc ribbon domain-containing protein [Lachnospiraceae bacterium]|nr:zinc ribbon domain-containing protein [Lachnospiraceae bacterium]
MDFFNKVGETLTSFGNGVGSKTRNMMDLSALTSQLHQHEDTLRKMYEEVGRKYYAEKKGQPEEAFAGVFSQIEAVEAAAGELRKKIEINKSMVTCPKCKGLTEAGSQFCKHCGNPMKTAEAPVQQNQPVQTQQTGETDQNN